MKKIISLLITISLCFSADKLEFIPINNNLISTDNGGTLSAIEAYSDGVGVVFTGPTLYNNQMNTMVYEYGEEALANGSTTLKDFVYTNGTNNDSVNAYNIPIVNAYSFVIGDSCNDNNSNTINDVYKDINGTCLGEYILGATCNDTVETTYNDIYIDINGTCIGFPYLEKIYNTYYETGYSIKNIGMVKDISLSSIIQHIGTVEDSMNSTVNTYTGSVIDSMNSTVIPYTGSVIDYISKISSISTISATNSGSVLCGYKRVNASMEEVYKKLVNNNCNNPRLVLGSSLSNITGWTIHSYDFDGGTGDPVVFYYYKNNITYTCPSDYTLSGSTCSKNILSCPTGYTDNGSNCKKTINYNYYEYSCPTGYTAANAGYTTYTKTDPSNTTDNTTTLDDAVNTATAPVGNCKKTVNYNYYEYKCNDGYTITEPGLITYSKTDPDNTIDNYTELSKNVNENISPIENCKKDIFYDYYEYKCNTEGYNTIDTGYNIYNKIDIDKNIINEIELGTKVNNETPEINNCYITKYECPNGYIYDGIGCRN